MPRVSARQDCLKWVRKNLDLSILMCSSDSDDLGLSDDSISSGFCSPLLSASDGDLDSSSDSDGGIDVHDPMNTDDKPAEWIELNCLLESERFWSKHARRYQSKDFAETFFYEEIPDHLFRQMTRMGKEPFKRLVALIENHSVYQNDSHCPQAPVTLQLATTLDRMGHSGNGSCLKHTLMLWGISMGSTCNYTARTMEALEDCIGYCLKWPDAPTRTAIAAQFAATGFPGCVGLIDGTFISLAQKPADSGEVYYERKSHYSINSQVVCDHNRRIIFIHSGVYLDSCTIIAAYTSMLKASTLLFAYLLHGCSMSTRAPATCGDITCLRRSPLWDRLHGHTLFDRGQFLLSDSGYVNAPHLVCAYRMTLHDPDREAFNYCVAKTRVINEHCIGILKMRWFSLKELRIQLNVQADHVRMCKWIICCALLHNYVHDCNDPWTEEDMGSNIDVEPIVQPPLDPAQNRCRSRASAVAGRALMERVKECALSFNRQPGGCLWQSSTTGLR